MIYDQITVFYATSWMMCQWKLWLGDWDEKTEPVIGYVEMVRLLVGFGIIYDALLLIMMQNKRYNNYSEKPNRDLIY